MYHDEGDEQNENCVPLIVFFSTLVLLVACQNDDSQKTTSASSGCEMHLSDVYTSYYSAVIEVEIVEVLLVKIQLFPKKMK